MYPDGSYLFRVNSQTWTESKKGKPMLVLKGDPIAKVTIDEEGNEDRELVNRDAYERTIYVVIDGTDEEQMEFTMRKLRYSGFEGDSFADLDFTGKDVKTYCEWQEYNGKTRDSFNLSLPKAVQKPLESGALRRLDTLFGKKLKEGAKNERRPVVPAKESHRAAVEAQAPHEGDEDRIPF